MYVNVSSATLDVSFPRKLCRTNTTINAQSCNTKWLLVVWDSAFLNHLISQGSNDIFFFQCSWTSRDHELRNHEIWESPVSLLCQNKLNFICLNLIVLQKVLLMQDWVSRLRSKLNLQIQTNKLPIIKFNITMQYVFLFIAFLKYKPSLVCLIQYLISLKSPYT